jgi:crotonobetainyl-CoA:carnitine CoA-transferase CaiB-like acyl-CoA transferase
VILDGIKVVDLTHAVAGAFAARWLADMGADVVKVERFGGDRTRASGLEEFEDGSVVPAFGTANTELGAMGGMFLFANAGKKSVCVDFAVPEGLDIVKRLIAEADVVTENFTPGVLAKWGLSYADLTAIKPNIIMCSVSGFGADAPDPHRPCTEPVAMAMSGFSHMVGEPDGYPLTDGTGIGDPVTGTIGALGIVSALFHRERTGEGQRVDVCLLDSAFAMDTTVLPFVATTRGRFKPSRSGPETGFSSPYGIFKAKNGYIAMMAGGFGEGSAWSRFVRLIGREELLHHPDWATTEARRNRSGAVRELIETYLQATYPDPESAADALGAAGIVAGPVLTPNEAINHPHYVRRKMVTECETPFLGSMPVISTPIKFSATEARASRGSFLGEGNEAVLADWLEMSHADLDQLYECGAIEHDTLIDALRANGELPDPWGTTEESGAAVS